MDELFFNQALEWYNLYGIRCGVVNPKIPWFNIYTYYIMYNTFNERKKKYNFVLGNAHFSEFNYIIYS